MSNIRITKFLSKSKIVSELNQLLSYLTKKEREVLSKRFGINGNEETTLASIGDKMSLTRERIRQIQVQATKKLQRAVRSSDLLLLNENISDFIESNGGIASEAELVNHIDSLFDEDLKEIKNSLLLIAEFDKDLRHEHNKVDYRPHFRSKKIKFSQIKETSYLATKCLKAEKNVVSKSKLYEYIKKNYSEEFDFNSQETVNSALRLDRRLRDHGESFSLLAWRHVNPRTLFDKIVYVLNDTNQPMHFREIADSMVDKKLRKQNSSIQAIHNELIGNSMFVLIGRGTYALKDWGYEEGTVSEVIESILSEEGPLSLNDLTQKVLQRRKVKEVTVQVNLNTKKDIFKKNTDGQYELV
jgi:putative ubiquitin-RnfH superfamily antitoxin RatB of RatAB toxin-antitoxin module